MSKDRSLVLSFPLARAGQSELSRSDVTVPLGEGKGEGDFEKNREGVGMVKNYEIGLKKMCVG